MSLAVVTGACGLVGAEAVEHFLEQGFEVVGIDNDMRRRFFGAAGSTAWLRERHEKRRGYRHVDSDIRDDEVIDKLFRDASSSILLIVHTAAQPSHDWAVGEPKIDFTINANGTLNLLQAARQHCPDAVFITVSTSKVYGDRPNTLPLQELETRWELDPVHEEYDGIRESFPIDQSLHSLFGVSKLAGDLLTQEFGRYFGMKTACFRPGCVTGSRHAAVELHGFLSYLVRCAVTRTRYRIFGYLGKQVRCNIHARDLVLAFDSFFRAPRSGAVYNIGGGRESSCSVLEAIEVCGELAGEEMAVVYDEKARVGDHRWWISSNARFQRHYPSWRPQYDVQRLLGEVYGEWLERTAAAPPALTATS